jgi:hypothetical protein
MENENQKWTVKTVGDAKKLVKFIMKEFVKTKERKQEIGEKISISIEGDSLAICLQGNEILEKELPELADIWEFLEDVEYAKESAKTIVRITLLLKFKIPTIKTAEAVERAIKINKLHDLLGK